MQWPFSSGLENSIIWWELNQWRTDSFFKLFFSVHPPISSLSSQPFPVWAQYPRKKEDWRSGDLFHRERTRKQWSIEAILWLHKYLTWIKERIKTDENIVSIWNYHALQKHSSSSICMVVLMLHQHKTQYKPSNYIRITASQVYKFDCQTSSTPVHNRNMQDNVLKN